MYVHVTVISYVSYKTESNHHVPNYVTLLTKSLPSDYLKVGRDVFVDSRGD